MFADDLRKSILQAAIQGKLSEQLPTDGNASDLLKNIQIEKAKSIKQKKIKATPPLPPIAADEIPFDIPENWQWVRLGNICNYGESESINPPNMIIGKFLLDLEDIEKDSGKLINKKFFDGNNAKSTKSVFYKGNVLYGKLRPYLNKVLVADDDGYCTSEILPLNFGKNIFNGYAKYFLISPFFSSYATNLSCGTKMPRLRTEDGKKALFPMPPLAEQERIVARLEELLAEIEPLAEAEKEIDQLEKEFPQKIKASLLQAAIQGKLSKQLPTDGNARQLLRDIQIERAKLFKQKKIKAAPPLPPISPDEIPFDIPENWQWVRLGDICTKLVDGNHNPPSGLSEKTNYLMLSSKNINFDKLIDLDSTRFLSKELFEKENKRTSASAGDIFFTSVGSLGRSCIFDGSLNVCFQRSVTVIKTEIYNKYLKFCFDSPFYQKVIINESTGTAQKGFYLSKMEKSLIPMPPLAEQERIVARLEELLAEIEI